MNPFLLCIILIYIAANLLYHFDCMFEHTHHTGSWTEHMCISSQTPMNIHQMRFKTALKLFFFGSRTATYSIYFFYLMSVHYSVYMWGDKNGNTPAKVAKKLAPILMNYFPDVSCITVLWNFAPWTIGVTHHRSWTCGWNDQYSKIIIDIISCHSQKSLTQK